MKKILITLALILSYISVAVAADINFEPYNLQIQNVGNRNLYVALSFTLNHYTNIIGMAVNGKTVKQEVWEFIAPNQLISLQLKPAKDFNNYVSSPDMYYWFSFGLTLQAAQYDFDSTFIGVMFNAKPFAYTLSNTDKAITSYVINSNTTQYNIDSDNSIFIY